MRVLKAKLAGFCPGVKRAWQKIAGACKIGPVFVLSDLIHNRQAIQRLEEIGVITIHDLRKVSQGDQVIIRAHGEPPETYKKLKKKGARIIDTTCFRVRKVQEKAGELEKNGYRVVVCGEKGHPEVRATLGYTKRGRVVSTSEEAGRLNLEGKVALLSQTTFPFRVFQEIQKVLEDKKGVVLKVLGTICDFTRAAQKEAEELGKKVDYLVVVGGKCSSNTKRLKEVGEKIRPTFHIESVGELKPEWFEGKRSVGLLAGASTPPWIISQVERKLKKL